MSDEASRRQVAAAVTAILAGAALLPAQVHGQAAASQANAEITTLTGQFGLSVTQLAATAGNTTLTAAQSLTAASLPNAVIQSNPPQLGTAPAFPPEQQDGVIPPPFQSNGLNNFRFSYFHNLYAFFGYHTWSTEDYAAIHGFDALGASYRDQTTDNWEPAGTQWMSSSTTLNWDSLMSTLHLDPQRWDELVDAGEANVIQAIIQANPNPFPQNPAHTDQLQIDIEIQPLDPATLRTQSWYPSGGTAQAKAAFEKKYYDGFAMTQYAPVDAARQLGFKGISLYGWDPAAAGWWTLATYPTDPSGDWFWQQVGLQVISHVDIVNNSVYGYYWDPAYVAYTLAQNDLNLGFVNSLPTAQRKPVRPYFTNQLTGGGGGWRWWRGQALPTEELRAVALLNAFTQYDGMALWNWSGTGNDSIPPTVTTGVDVMLKDNAFTANQQGGGTRTFSRYEAVHVTSADGSGNIQFQLLNLDSNNNYGVGPTFPVYTSTVAGLTPHLRVPSEPLSGLFEGLALAKLLEWNLRNDNPVVDFDSRQVFAQVSPVSRHVKNGDLHILATYDPRVVYGQPARNVTINNFNGVSGLNLMLAADSQVRLYAVRVPAGLLGRWRFDEGTGSSTADASGYGHSGTLVNGPTWVTGAAGSALNFNGGTTSVAVNGATNTANLYKSGMTLSAWIKPVSAGAGGGGRIVDKDNNDCGWFLKMNSAGTSVQFAADQYVASGTTPGAAAIRNSTAAIVLNQWQHVAVTWDGSQTASNIHIFVNGVAADSTSGLTNGSGVPVSDAGTPLTIGNRPVDNARGFNGAVDDVRIYNGVLTSAQIQAIAGGS